LTVRCKIVMSSLKAANLLKICKNREFFLSKDTIYDVPVLVFVIL
jgi:hypothetical protein